MAEVPAPPRRSLRFSSFELDVQSGELRKAGVVVGLQDQSLKVLIELLERPGDLVTREQLRQRLWPNGTFVDFEHGLNAVINRLRETLGDSADSPRFIQTVPRRGYRFIAPVEGAGVDAQIDDVTSTAVLDTPPATRTGWWRWIAAAAALVTIVAAAIAATWLVRPSPPVEIVPPRVVALTRLAGSETWPTFAPDGEQVAFAWSGEKDDNTDIYVTLVGSTGARRLTTDPADDYAPSWSPDGRRIAFLRRFEKAARIHVVSALGGSESQVSEFPVGATVPNSLFTAEISWSPDGRYLAAGLDPRATTPGSAGIYLIPIDGGESVALTRPRSPTFHFSPVFSPGGRHVAYAACEIPGLDASTLMPDNCSVASVQVDASFAPVRNAKNLTPQPAAPAGLAWSRDGRSILFVAEGSSSFGLWRLWIDSTRPPEAVEIAGSHASHPASAPSRDRLAFSRYDWEMHLYRFAPGKPLERVAASSSHEGDPHFSPDGRRIAFASGRSGEVAIWVAAADGSDPRQLTSHQWTWQGSPNWSPDGRTIAFDAYDPDGHVHVWTIPAVGGTPRRITKPTGDQTVPTWSRDGKWIYYSEARQGGRDIWRVPATGGPAQQLTRTGTGFLAYETADGTSLLYQAKYGDSPLLVMPLTVAGPPRHLIECVRHASFIPVGTTIFYAGCEPGTTPSLHSIDVVTGRDRLLGTLELFQRDPLGHPLAVSPDRKTILFSGLMRKGADLMLIENFR